MEFKVETFLSPDNVETLRRTGLHKVAGAMAGTDELTIKHAVSLIGTKAYQRRRETQKIAAGLKALADLTNEKVADTVWGPLMQKAMGPAVLGMGAAALPAIMSHQELDPMQIAMGGVLGGTVGMGQAMANVPKAIQAPYAAALAR